eukprot:m51a1_g12105 hypothetical protein (136) ;mRNA; f:113-603
MSCLGVLRPRLLRPCRTTSVAPEARAATRSIRPSTKAVLPTPRGPATRKHAECPLSVRASSECSLSRILAAAALRDSSRKSGSSPASLLVRSCSAHQPRASSSNEAKSEMCLPWNGLTLYVGHSAGASDSVDFGA